jgi:hypothetical protein
MSILNFDATSVQPAQSFDPLPAGDYLVYIKNSDMKPTAAGNGYYLELTLEVLDGPHTGRLIWDRLNLDNPNQKAVEIAQRTLSAICHAVNVLNVSDSAELHDKPLVAKVVIEEGRGDYAPRNQIKGYKASSAGVSAPAPVARPAASVPPPQAAAASAGASRPWAR